MQQLAKQTRTIKDLVQGSNEGEAIRFRDVREVLPSLVILIDVIEKMLNVKHTSDNKAKAIIANFIIRHFGILSESEIRNAFELAFAQKLPGKPVETYQNINPEYVGKVLHQYKEYRKPYVQEYLIRKKKEQAKREHKEKLFRNLKTRLRYIDFFQKAVNELDLFDDEFLSQIHRGHYEFIHNNLYSFTPEEKRESVNQANELIKPTYDKIEQQTKLNRDKKKDLEKYLPGGSESHRLARILLVRKWLMNPSLSFEESRNRVQDIYNSELKKV